jgi:hypothetical protein
MAVMRGVAVLAAPRKPNTDDQARVVMFGAAPCKRN